MQRKVITNNKDIAHAIKERRKELGITQKNLADFCQLSNNGISKLEVNESDVKLSTLLKISKLLGFKIVFEIDQ